MAASDNDIAIVGFAQTAPQRRTNLTEADLVLRSTRQVIADVGIDKSEIGFTVSGSCDYLSGQGFSFVQNTDAYGMVPAINESHVEMDGAWAMYEAYVRLLQGDIDIAMAVGVGKNSNSDPETLFTVEFDPYYLPPSSWRAGSGPMTCASVRHGSPGSITASRPTFQPCDRTSPRRCRPVSPPRVPGSTRHRSRWPRSMHHSVSRS